MKPAFRPDNPAVDRIASCSGVRFIHEARDLPADQRLDCTAGPHCTGLHGPAGYRQDIPCWHELTEKIDGADARPTINCGYRGRGACLGGASVSPAADLIWEQRAHH